MIWKASDIVVRLDNGRFAEPALNDVGIDRPLYKKVNGTDLTRRFLEDTNKFLSNDLSFLFRLCYAPQFFIETVLRIDTDEIDIIDTRTAKDRLDLIPLVFAQESMVHKDAGELTSDRLREQNCRNRGIDTA